MTLVLGYDIETTSADVEKDRIVEIAATIQDLESGIERLRYVRRIDPQMNIAAAAMRVHGITNADVLGCPLFKDVAAPLVMLFKRVDIVVGHNIEGFDIPLTINEFLRAGITDIDPFPAIFDTMVHGRSATADGKVPTLGELCWALDVPYDTEQAHGAAYDVEVNLAAFREGIRLGVFKLPELSSKETLAA